MLVEGRIKQPPSTRSEISNCAASVWSAQSPSRTAPDPHQTVPPPSSHRLPTCCRPGAGTATCFSAVYSFTPTTTSTTDRSISQTSIVGCQHQRRRHTHHVITLICKLLILLILISYILFSSPVSFVSFSSLFAQPSCCHLLIISIIIFYYYFRFRLRTLFKFVYSLCLSTVSRSSCLQSQPKSAPLLSTSTTSRLIQFSSSLARQTSLKPSRPSTSSIDSLRPSHHHNLTPNGLSVRLILVAMVMLTLSSVDFVPNSLNRLHGVAASSDSDLLLKHSIKEASTHRTSSGTTINRNDLHAYEHKFFSMMGLDAKPRPSRHRKVPEHMLDLYHWFREGNIASQRERELVLQQDSDNGRPPSITNDKNSVLALVSDDLADLSMYSELEPLEDDQDENVIQLINKHHRIPRRKRQTQPSRVTLQGPANTVISHKLSHQNHPDGKLNRRIKRSSSIDRDDLQFSPGNEVHLTFDVHLPTGEFLKGSELRMYRHSIYDLGITTPGAVKQKHRKVTQHNNFWPLYRDSTDRFAPGSSSLTNVTDHTTTTTAHNSHSLLQNNSFSSGEEYSGSEKSSLPPHDDSYFMQRINIYHLLRPIDELQQIKVRKSNGEEVEMVPVTKLIDTQVVDVRDSGWLSFDVFPATERWLSHPSENFGLLVTFMCYKGRRQSPHSKLVVVNPEDSYVQSNSQTEKNEAWEEVQPLLITYSNTKHLEAHTLLQRSRVKRHQPGQQQHHNHQKQHSSGRSRGSKRKKYKNSGKQRQWCSRHQLFVDFSDVGWNDWIVAPPGFQAFYCSGECSYPMGHHLNTTNHAIIQSLVNSINKAVVPEPCCIPTDLSSITLLYLDQHEKIVLKNYKDMVVEGCGCS